MIKANKNLNKITKLGKRRPLRLKYQQIKNNFSFFEEETGGCNMSQKTIQLINDDFMGFFYLLHSLGIGNHQEQSGKVRANA